MPRRVVRRRGATWCAALAGAVALLGGDAGRAAQVPSSGWMV
ncbi:hypothetical protein [Streptomyces litchfieldiae]|nr:hypothetical protein [Streptomyces sp. DSM 44938]